MLNTGRLAGKVLYISGASRGIGLEFAKKAARDGAKVAIAAKTAEPHPKLPGTIYTAAKEIEALGGTALPLIVDVRNEDDIQKSVEDTVRQLGGIDIVINNASAISLTGTQETPMKTYDLMHSINTRGTYLVSKCALPYLKESASKGRNPHILNNSPPLSMKPIWFKNHVAYTMAKYGMSMCVLGMAEEFREHGIAVNAIWPKTAIMTAAMVMMGGGDSISAQCRTPQIMADAAYVILTRHSREFTGNFCVDEHLLREVGVKDFSQYLAPGATEDSLMPDFFLEEFLEAQGGEDMAEEIVKMAEKPAIRKAAAAAAPAAPVAGGGQIEAVFGEITKALSEDLVKKTNAVYTFKVTDDGSEWFLDLKNGSGACGQGASPVPADANFKMTSVNFGKMFAGKLKPTAAFMTGKLKIEGNMGKAMKLEKLMGKMQTRGFHTVGRQAPSSRGLATSPTLATAPAYTEVAQVLDRIRSVTTPKVVKKVNAVFVFNVEGEGKWHVDLKTEEGSVGEGEPPSKADVTVHLSKDTFLQIFNRELKPATAFMSGQVKFSGDMSKAMALESVMKATREH